jgi:hypothetical protein
MKKRRTGSKTKKYRKKFNGERTDTDEVRTETSGLFGYTYRVRKDGSHYPKLTSISVTKPTLDIYATLRQAGNYQNYDELLMDILTHLIIDKHISPFIAESLENRIRFAKAYIRMRKKSRSKADARHRYYPRKTGVIGD